jgi:acyl carrier protein
MRSQLGSFAVAVPSCPQLTALHITVFHLAFLNRCLCYFAVLITGGMGTLGSQVAAWLAQQQLRQLHLLGRSGRLLAGSASGEGLALLEPASATFAAAMTMAMCDAASAGGVAGLAATTGGSRPVLGLMHAGGVLADGVLGSQTMGSLRTVFAPKVQAAVYLDSACSRQPSAFQLLFSSVAALLGSPGQANYSAANAALDAAAQCAQQAGSTTISVQWGAWAGAGMAAGDASTASRVERTGMALLLPQQGLAALQGLLGPSQGQPASPVPPLLAANAFIWEKFNRRFGSAAVVPPFFAEFASGAALEQAVVGAASGGTTGARRPGGGALGLSAADRKAAVFAQVQDAVRGILGSEIGGDESLMAAGLDSLGAVELKNSLEGRLGLQLPGTLVFDYPSVAAIAGFIETQLPEQDESEDEQAYAADGSDELPPSPLALRAAVAALPEGAAVALLGMSSRTAQVRGGCCMVWMVHVLC